MIVISVSSWFFCLFSFFNKNYAVHIPKISTSALSQVTPACHWGGNIKGVVLVRGKKSL